MDPQRYLGLFDMLDGGGPGRSGDTFQGGPLSDLLNMLGIRPRGYRDRLAATQEPPAAPAPLPMMPAPRPRPAPAPAPAPTNLPYAIPGQVATAPIADVQTLMQMLYQNPELAAALRRQMGYAPPPVAGFRPQ